MPIYEFACLSEECKRIFEQLAKHKEIVKCPECGGETERVLSAHSGYTIKGPNGASVRPKNAGSFRRK